MAATTESVLTTVQDKVVVVTGGCSGLGLATAIYLNQRGAKLILLDINRERGEEVVASQLKPHTSIFIHCDVRDENSVNDALEQAVSRFGRIDVVVNNAGIMPPHCPIYDATTQTVYPLQEIKDVIDVNVIGMLNVLRLSVPHLARNDADADGERGVMINTGSISGLDASIHQLPYVLSKAAINGVTISLAHELAEHGIRVCTIAPGCFNTPMAQNVSAKDRETHSLTNFMPLRMGEGEEYAHLVCSIIENSMFNGALIRLDAALRIFSKPT